MTRNEALRAIAIERLRAPITRHQQLTFFATCAGCGAQIVDLRDERRPAGAEGPTTCIACSADVETQLPRAVKLLEGIEAMTTPERCESPALLAGAALGWWSKRLGRSLTRGERVVWVVAAYRYWTTMRAAA